MELSYLSGSKPLAYVWPDTMRSIRAVYGRDINFFHNNSDAVVFMQ
jgi:hypothetical protein